MVANMLNEMMSRGSYGHGLGLIAKEYILINVHKFIFLTYMGATPSIILKC